MIEIIRLNSLLNELKVNVPYEASNNQTSNQFNELNSRSIVPTDEDVKHIK